MTAFTLFLDWELNCQFAGPVWAREKGLYRQLGLEVTLSPPSAQDGLDLVEQVLDQELAAGSIEENLVVRAALAGEPLRAVAAMFKESPLVLMTPRGGPIKNLADLPGRCVAMHRDGLRLLETLLTLNGIDPESVNRRVGNWSLEDLIKGRFDAVQGYAITEVRALAKHGFAAETIPLGHENLNPHSQVIFASLDGITHRKNHLRAFLQATFDGWRQVIARPEEAAALVAAQSSEHADLAENRAILGSIGRYLRGPVKSEPLGSLDPARWRRNLASYASCGITERPADLDLVIEADLFSSNIVEDRV